MRMCSIVTVVALSCSSCNDAGSGADGSDAGESGTEGSGDASGYGPGGCGRDADALARTLVAAELERSFALTLPDDYDPTRAYPVIFAWHASRGNGNLARAYFGLDDVVGDEGIVVYPNALPLEDGEPGWDLTEDGRDVAFFDALLEHVTEGLCVDQERVFSTGHSFGAFMTNTLGCARADALRAIAPVAGGGPFFDCQGDLAVWLTHGEADQIVPIQTGTSSRDRWTEHNACTEQTVAQEPGACEAFTECTAGVVWCPHPGDHSWPDFAASAMWEFFSAQ
ncbi:MAG: hypothetical protein AAGF11_15270 [Myxococcota bacterium]